jgi:transposase-like protein
MYVIDVCIILHVSSLARLLRLGPLQNRGNSITHEAVRDWEARFAPLLADQLRTKRHGQAGTSWYVDETYLKVHGKWCYLYRAIDHEGNLVDSMLSEKRIWRRLSGFSSRQLRWLVMLPIT